MQGGCQLEIITSDPRPADPSGLLGLLSDSTSLLPPTVVLAPPPVNPIAVAATVTAVDLSSLPLAARELLRPPTDRDG